MLSKGWDMENAVSADLFVRPTLNTEAPIKEHFRVLDETELNRLAADFNGDKEQLKSQASRTFVFKLDYLTLLEYDIYGRYVGKRNVTIKGDNRFNHVLDLLTLKADHYYTLTATGSAKEIINGKEVDPLKWNESKWKYENVAWTQTKTYYFRTKQATDIADCPETEELEQYVALAFPSDYNKLKSENTFDAYFTDVRSPNISFYADMSNRIFKKGKLVWTLKEKSTRLVRSGSRVEKSISWNLLESKDAQWVVTDSTCNLTNVEAFDADMSSTKTYLLEMNYIVTSVANRRLVSDTTNVVQWYVKPCNGAYSTGKYETNVSLAYEKPFIGMRLDKVEFNTGSPQYTGYAMGFYNKYTVTYPTGKTVPARYTNPYTYIAYMSNYGLVGGWELTNSKLKMNATTSQSLIYRDKGGVYEGTYDNSDENTLNAEYFKVLRQSVRTSPSYEFPLPVMTDSKYNYAHTGTAEAYELTLGNKEEIRLQSLLMGLYDVYYAVDLFDSKFRVQLQNLFAQTDEADIDYADWVQDEMEDHAGTYISATVGNATIEVPYYQMGILWGSHFEHTIINGKKGITMWGSFDGIPDGWSRPDEKMSENIVVGLIGNSPTKLLGVSKVVTGTDSKGKYTESNAVKYIDFWPYRDNIKNIYYSHYRVNAFNHKRAQYTVSQDTKLNKRYAYNYYLGRRYSYPWSHLPDEPRYKYYNNCIYNN